MCRDAKSSPVFEGSNGIHRRLMFARITARECEYFNTRGVNNHD